MAQKSRYDVPQNSKVGPKAPMWRPNKASGDASDWSSVDAGLIRGCIDAVTKAGGAVMFGVTADGGAFSLCLLQNDEKLKDYPHSTAECEERLQALIDWYVDFKL